MTNCHFSSLHLGKLNDMELDILWYGIDYYPKQPYPTPLPSNTQHMCSTSTPTILWTWQQLQHTPTLFWRRLQTCPLLSFIDANLPSSLNHMITIESHPWARSSSLIFFWKPSSQAQTILQCFHFHIFTSFTILIYVFST